MKTNFFLNETKLPERDFLATKFRVNCWSAILLLGVVRKLRDRLERGGGVNFITYVNCERRLIQ